MSGAFDNAQLAELIAVWRRDPVRMVVDEFGVTPDPWQADALRRFNAGPHGYQLAMVACKGPGKSAVLSWIDLLWMATRPYAQAQIASVTADNLRDGLWKEIAFWLGRSTVLRQLFAMNNDRLFARQAPKVWFTAAKTWPKNADPDEQCEALAGFHADYGLVLLDEASALPPAVLEAAQGVLTSGVECKVGMAGNPTKDDGALYQGAVDEAADWDVIRVTGDPDDPACSPRINKERNRKMIRNKGRSHPWVMASVLARFPTRARTGLVSRQDVEDAFRRYETGEGVSRGRKTMGADVARQGDDRTAVVLRDGDYVEDIREWTGEKTVFTREELAAIADSWGPEDINIDEIGVGGGPADELEDREYPVNCVHVGEAADRDDEFINLRAEMAVNVEERFEQGRIALNPKLRETTLGKELMTVWMEYAESGKRKLAPKRRIKKKLGHSPDLFDALSLAFADGMSVEDGGAVFASHVEANDAAA